MANTRFKGANASERLTLPTLSDSDMFQTRHLPGTVNDADKGVSKSLLQALPVAVCATAAATAAKVGTLAAESCPDFILISGRAVQVYFSTANTASTPTLNLYGTGAIPIVYPDGSFVETWGASTWMTLMYVSVTIDGTLTQRWVVVSSLPVDEVAADNMNSVTSNAVAELENIINEKINGKIIGQTKSGTNSVGWGNYINLGVLPEGKYAVVFFQNGFDVIAVQSASINYFTTSYQVYISVFDVASGGSGSGVNIAGYSSASRAYSINALIMKIR